METILSQKIEERCQNFNLSYSLPQKVKRSRYCKGNISFIYIVMQIILQIFFIILKINNIGKKFD